jgi:hypothetical protein
MKYYYVPTSKLIFKFNALIFCNFLYYLINMAYVFIRKRRVFNYGK